MNQEQNQNKGLFNILFSVIIPVLILNKLSGNLGAELSLILALAFPIGWGAFEFFKYKEFSFVAILGFLNTLITGSFALMKLQGIWFAVKEAAFPLLIGVFVLGSTFMAKPFIETLILNPAILDLDKIFERLNFKDKMRDFRNSVKFANLALSFSFFLSSFLNFVLAIKIFVAADPSLSVEAQANLLNEQIAQMTYQGMLVIALPSFVILITIFFLFLRNLGKLTELKLDEMLKNDSTPAANTNP